MSTKTICNWTVIAGIALILTATILLFLGSHFQIELDLPLWKRAPFPFMVMPPFMLIGGLGLLLFTVSSLALVLIASSTECFHFAKLYFLGSVLIIGLLLLIAQNVHDGTLLLVLPLGMSLLFGLLFVLAGTARVVATRYKA